MNKNATAAQAVCPRCGQAYTGRPAMAKDNSGPICPDCGIRESLESIGVCAEERERILDIIHRYQV